MSAPAGATFAQDSLYDFGQGRFTNTRAAEPGSVVVAGIAGDTGSYVSPVIPAEIQSASGTTRRSRAA